MKRFIAMFGAALVIVPVMFAVARVSVVAQPASPQGTPPAPAPNQSVPIVNNVPLIPFDVVPNFFKITPDQNFGETLSVAVNSKGNIVVLNHPGTATSGPLYGNATTQVLEFDSNGKFLREIGKGVYGLGYAHSVRFDRYDNLWVVDKGTNSIMKFNPAGYVTMNLGRRMEGYEGEYHRLVGAQARTTDGNYMRMGLVVCPFRAHNMLRNRAHFLSRTQRTQCKLVARRPRRSTSRLTNVQSPRKHETEFLVLQPARSVRL